MKITRNLLAALALASATTAFAGDPGSVAARKAEGFQQAQSAKDMAKTGHEASAPNAREQAAGTDADAKVCCVMPCPMGETSQSKPVHSEGPVGSAYLWHLPS